MIGQAWFHMSIGARRGAAVPHKRARESPLLPIAAILIAVSVGACHKDPPATAPLVAPSGPLAVTLLNGRPHAVVARIGLDASTVAVVDLSAAENAPPVHVVVLPKPVSATVAVAGARALVAGLDGQQVWSISLEQGAIDRTYTLPGDLGSFSFSGYSGKVAGIAFDPAGRQALLAFAGELGVLDVGRGSLSRRTLVPPSEAFVVDPAGRAWMPFYGCAQASGDAARRACAVPVTSAGAAVTEGLTAVDLASGKAFNFRDDTAPDPAFPVGRGPDSAALDAALGLLLIPAEFDRQLHLVDVAHAQFDPASASFTAPQRLLNDLQFDAAAIEPTRHLALLLHEESGEVALVSLPGGAVVRGSMPPMPDGTAYNAPADPHAVAAALDAAGRSVGLLYDGASDWMAALDLPAIAAEAGPLDQQAMRARVRWLRVAP